MYPDIVECHLGSKIAPSWEPLTYTFCQFPSGIILHSQCPCLSEKAHLIPQAHTFRIIFHSPFLRFHFVINLSNVNVSELSEVFYKLHCHHFHTILNWYDALNFPKCLTFNYLTLTIHILLLWGSPSPMEILSFRLPNLLLVPSSSFICCLFVLPSLYYSQEAVCTVARVCSWELEKSGFKSIFPLTNCETLYKISKGCFMTHHVFNK